MTRLDLGLDQVGKRPIPTGIEALERRLGEDPNGPQAEAMLQKIASLLSTQLKSAKSAARPPAATAPLAADRGREALGSVDWIGRVPPALKDDLLAAIIAAQEALIAELGAGDLTPPGDVELARLVESAALAHGRRGLAASLHLILRDAPRGLRSAACETLSERLAATDRQAALRLYWLSYGLSPSPAKARKIAQRMFKLGDLSGAGALADLADSGAMTPFMGEVRLSSALFRSPPSVVRKSGRPARHNGSVAYVASSALPYKVVGYTVRTHNLLSALRAEGVEVSCYVRPGYPWDRPAVLGAGEVPTGTRRVEAVDYTYSRVTDITREPEQFVQRMADALEAQFRASKPRLVHAASNHRTALPALLAARKLSLPFVYEVRGLWELTAATKNPWWEETERFAFERSLELFVAQNADHVLTITRGVAEELVGGGVESDKISLLPNGVDPSRFTPGDPDPELRRRLDLVPEDLVLVYCGSLTNYEGLDDLIEAVSALNPAVRARLVIVGDGPYLESLRSAAAAARFGAAVRFVGSVAPGDIHRYWSLADVVALPRKPFKVCRVVSPLKPFEAMAMAKPVILSDLPASREIVRDGETGLICRPDDPADLAATIARLARDPALRRDLGSRAREWVTAHHSWQMNARRLITLYDRLAPLGLSSESSKGTREDRSTHVFDAPSRSESVPDGVKQTSPGEPKARRSGKAAKGSIGIAPFRGTEDSLTLSTRSCPICGTDPVQFGSKDNCPKCDCTARTRTFAPVVEQVIRPALPHALVDLAVLAFAMDEGERTLLSSLNQNLESVSLYGNYGAGHKEGVDARDLSRYEGESFCGVYGIGLYDFFPEHPQALNEAFRVLGRGGFLATIIMPDRVLPGAEPPQVTHQIQSRADYFQYMPKDKTIPSIKVGKKWFLAEMQRVGFVPQHVLVRDEPSGLEYGWFLGFKPGRPRMAKTALQAPRIQRLTAATKAESRVYSTPLDPATGCSSV